MEGFTVVDAGVFAIVILSGILAYSRGLVREVLAIAGWVAAAIVGYMFAPQAEPLIQQIPVVGDFLRESCELSIIASFAIVATAALVVVSIFAPLFAGLIQRSALGGIDQGLGFLFGVARGLLLIAVAFFVYEMVVTEEILVVDDSKSAEIFAQMTDRIQEQRPEDALGWVTDKYEDLIGGCSPEADDDAPITPPPAVEEAAPTEGETPSAN